jgi:hypothetical protein
MTSLALRGERIDPEDPRCGRVLEMLWYRMIAEGTLNAFCTVQPPESWGVPGWMKKLEGGAHALWVGFLGDEVCGFAMVEGIRPRRAQAHFVTFRSCGRHIFRAGRFAVRFLIGHYNLDCLFGLVPETNRAAVKFLERIDGKRIGVLPGGSYLHALDRSVNSVVIAWTRNGGTRDEDL